MTSMLAMMSLPGLAMLGAAIMPDFDSHESDDHEEDADRWQEPDEDIVPLDELLGSGARDVIFASDGDQRVEGFGGDDHLDGGDVLAGGEGADVLHGGSGDDVLRGGADAVTDYLNGGAGDDLIVAGAGDVASGGTGADGFALEGSGAAVITDYAPATDHIRLHYDATGPAPELTTEIGDDGLALYSGGELVAVFEGVEVLDTAAIELVPG